MLDTAEEAEISDRVAIDIYERQSCANEKNKLTVYFSEVFLH